MEAYPLSVRRRIITLYRAGESTEEIAERFGYCVAGVRRVRQRFEDTGSVEPRRTKPGRKPALGPAALGRLAARVAAVPDATLAELRAHVGVAADLAVYCRALKKLGLTRKKRSGPRRRAGPAGREGAAGPLARRARGRAARQAGLRRRVGRDHRPAAAAGPLAAGRTLRRVGRRGTGRPRR